MELVYDKLAEIFRQPTPNKIVTFLANGGQEEEYDDLAQYLCEVQSNMHEMVAIVNLSFHHMTSPEMNGLLQKFHVWARFYYQRYRDMHFSAAYGDLVGRTCIIYKEMKTTLGDQLPPAITTVRRLNEIIQHYKL